MAPKEQAKKALPAIVRMPISTSSLVYVPDDAIEGFEERLENGVDWTLEVEALRHHRSKAIKQAMPSLTFSQAIENKLKDSLLSGFLDEASQLCMKDQYEVVLTTALWDNDNFANDEGRICFLSANNFTEDVLKLVKRAVRIGDRRVLSDSLEAVEVLRLNNAKMTNLDSGIKNYKRLVSLVLCGNYITELDGSLIPSTLRSLELQANHISNIKSFVEFLPQNLIYLGLSKNVFTSETVNELSRLPYNLTVLDLSDNDIYDLKPVLSALGKLPCLNALYLAGNPCSVSYGYARYTLTELPRLKWLDGRQVIAADRPPDSYEFHPDDLRCTYFLFSIIRVIGAPVPPKQEKGVSSAFHIELDIPLLDVTRRRFLMYHDNDLLTEMLPPPEDDEVPLDPELSTLRHNSRDISKAAISKGAINKAAMNKDTNSLGSEEFEYEDLGIYAHLVAKNSREIKNYTTYESNKVQWSKIMTFQEPTVKIFCPDLTALRNTFRSCITVRLVYTVTHPKAQVKKSAHTMKTPPEQRVTIASVRCGLKNPDWSQPAQHFHWDETLETNDAIHWGDGDLSVLQYGAAPAVNPKTKRQSEVFPTGGARQHIPDALTCHFGFGIDTLRIL